MKKLIKWGSLGLLGLTIAMAAVGFWKREELTRLFAVNSLFSEEKIVSNFSNMDAAFLSTQIDRGQGPTSEIGYGADVTLPSEVEKWITDRQVTSLIISRDNAILYENYFAGTNETDLRISWSVAKSFLSALLGILLDEGVIASLDDPVTQYAPALVGSAYDGATIKNVLQMSSGVTFDEDYLDKNSDINKMGRVLALGGSMDEFAAGLTARDQDPGVAWQYVSIDTHVLGMVIRGATGRTIADLLGEKIIEPLGLEAAPYYLTDGFETAFVLGGLNLRSRDYLRFGLMVANGGQWNGQQIVPRDWLEASTKPSANTKPGEIGYGYQWWVPQGSTGREFMARGVYGQYIYFDLDQSVVIVSTAADRKFRDDGIAQLNVDMFRLMATSVKDE